MQTFSIREIEVLPWRLELCLVPSRIAWSSLPLQSEIVVRPDFQAISLKIGEGCGIKTESRY